MSRRWGYLTSHVSCSAIMSMTRLLLVRFRMKFFSFSNLLFRLCMFMLRKIGLLEALSLVSIVSVS